MRHFFDPDDCGDVFVVLCGVPAKGLERISLSEIRIGMSYPDKGDCEKCLTHPLSPGAIEAGKKILAKKAADWENSQKAENRDSSPHEGRFSGFSGPEMQRCPRTRR